MQYAQSGDVHVAYQVVGEGDLDLVLVQGFASNLDLEWEYPAVARFLRGLASFSRLIRFDKRGLGLSDRNVEPVPLEERMDDVRAVMDAVGSERAVLMGISEGAPMSILFAATYPERTQALVLYGGMARATEAPDYPWGPQLDGFLEATEQLIMPTVFDGADIDIWAPSLDEDPAAREWLGRYRRSAMSPDGIKKVLQMFLEIDVRHVLPSVNVPTLVIHRHGDRVVNWRASKWMAEQIPGAVRVELPGQDHFPWAGDSDAIVEEVRAFLTGTRVDDEADRVLATVMFTDVVGSTERAASLGDRRWTELLDAHDNAVRRELVAFRGHEVKTTGDGFLATFDGPARGIRCRACDPFGGERAGPRCPRRAAHGRDRTSQRRHRRPRGSHQPARLRGHAAGGDRRVEHGQGSRRGVRHRVRGPRRTRTEGRSRPLEAVRRHQLTLSPTVHDETTSTA